MNTIQRAIDFILHFDNYLGQIIGHYGFLTYFFLFLILFCETGLVITPFLPGDSLLFIAGTFAAQGKLNVFLLFFILSIAAILGDSLNYAIGNYLGDTFFEKNRFFKKEYLDKTKAFYKKHGAKTIIYARFVPIVRTFAPFVAGIGKMKYSTFISYNVLGGIVWVGLLVFAGYFFGGFQFVQEHLEMIIIGIILVSLLPPILEYLRNKKKK